MDFKLSSEQEAIRRVVREFAEKEISPIAQELDEKAEFPPESILKQMRALNLFGLTTPKEFGGAGVDMISYSLAIEEISRVCAGIGVILSVHNSVSAHPILAYGTKEQKEKYLPSLASGKDIGAFALTEPNAGSDAAAQETTAVLRGSHYILNGTKIFITSGSKAGVIIVMAMTDKSKGSRGISAFIVEKGAEGFSLGTKENKLGIRCSDTYELVFQDCKIPKENILGKEGEGFKVAMSTLDGGRIGIASQAVGIAQAALDASIKYAKEREQFKQPIAKFEAIQWMISDMATEIAAARLLTHRAAFLKDSKMRCSKEAAMAKVFASEAAMRATTKAIQIHGGYGYTKDYPVERYFRDAKITEIYEGTSEIQRIVISSNLLG